MIKKKRHTFPRNGITIRKCKLQSISGGAGQTGRWQRRDERKLASSINGACSGVDGALTRNNSGESRRSADVIRLKSAVQRGEPPTRAASFYLHNALFVAGLAYLLADMARTCVNIFEFVDTAAIISTAKFVALVFAAHGVYRRSWKFYSAQFCIISNGARQAPGN